MPVITLDYSDLLSLLGKDIPMDELLERIPMLGASLEGVDGNDISVEFFPNRPDLYSVEGVARALRGFLDLEKGLVQYPTEDSGIDFRVEESVTDVRPYVVGGVVRDVEMTDELVRSLMDMQEKLHLTIGRKRRKVSIGVHDLDAVVPPFVYKALPPEERSFIPLQGTREMNMAEILREHPKGVDYAFILKGKDKYPLIVDKNDDVLSFPPIINGILTAVTEETRNIFLDVTGLDYEAVHTALVVVATALAERGGRLQTVTLQTPEGPRVTPDLTPKKRVLNRVYANRLIGVDLSAEEMVDCLERMRLGCSVAGDDIEVLIPAYRNDVIHPADLVEDVAIAYGYDRIEPQLPKQITMGKLIRFNEGCNALRSLMIGYGYTEASTLSLVGEDSQAEGIDYVRIRNPITLEQATLRTSLIPSLIALLRANRHHELPQRFFEVGDVVIDTKNRRKLAGVSIHAKAGFTEVKSLVQSLLRDLGEEMQIEGRKDSLFIRGRAASITKDGKEIGRFGEVSPEVITKYELGYPIVGFELDLPSLLVG
ncbi:MAG: phenylalanine--tRNA ligase subunit beta [Thermoplasmata archaeon]